MLSQKGMQQTLCFENEQDELVIARKATDNISVNKKFKLSYKNYNSINLGS